MKKHEELDETKVTIYVAEENLTVEEARALMREHLLYATSQQKDNFDYDMSWVEENFCDFIDRLPDDAALRLAPEWDGIRFFFKSYVAVASNYEHDNRFYQTIVFQEFRFSKAAFIGLIAHEIAHFALMGHLFNEYNEYRLFAHVDGYADMVARDWGFDDEIDALRKELKNFDELEHEICIEKIDEYECWADYLLEIVLCNIDTDFWELRYDGTYDAYEEIWKEEKKVEREEAEEILRTDNDFYLLNEEVI